MKWKIDVAKNGDNTLILNDVFIYSKYKPKEDAARWIKAEAKSEYTNYLLIGLGLGYHLEALIAQEPNKPIIVYYFDEKEYEFFVKHHRKLLQKKRISIVNNLKYLKNDSNLQVLIPKVWVNAIGQQHPLYSWLDTIKINQQSYKRFEMLMKDNAERNVINVIAKSYPKRKNHTACLVSSGKSINETLSWLEEMQGSVDIYVVGSILKLMLNSNIQPMATVVTDPQYNTIEQLSGANYKGILYYLLTANAETVLKFHGDKYVLCQEGYMLSEEFAKNHKLPLLSTGGSVATTAFSLIEFLGYENLVLFGQDLGFEGQNTHAEGSTSGKSVITNLRVKANDGTMINTQPNLQVYHRWFNEACQQTSMQVYNTAPKGAAITNVPLITEEQFKGL